MFLFAPLLREIRTMVDTKIQAAVDTLRSTIVAESAQVKEALKAEVAAAIAPLVTQIAELKEALAAGTDVSAIVESIELATQEVSAIVAPIDPPLSAPTGGTTPVPEIE
jgi:hypothetical protein